MIMNSPVVSDNVFYCDSVICNPLKWTIFYWQYDYLNKQIMFTENKYKTECINYILDKIAVEFELQNSIFNFFEKDGREYIFLRNYKSKHGIHKRTYFLFEIKNKEYMLVRKFKHIIEKNYDFIEHPIIDEWSSKTNIYHGDKIYYYNYAKLSIHEICKNKYYSICENNLILFNVQNNSNELRKYMVINLSHYGNIKSHKNLKQRIYMTFQTLIIEHRNFLLIYDTDTYKFECDYSITNFYKIQKFGDLLLFTSWNFDITNPNKYDIIDLKNNVQSIKTHDIYFDFVL